MDFELYFNNENNNNEFEFLMEIVQNIPRIRIYPARPNIFETLTDSQFRDRFRFHKATVTGLAEIFHQYLAPQCSRSTSLSTINQILLALRFLATGCYQMTAGDLFNCHQTTVCRKVPVVLRKIAQLGNMGAIKLPSSAAEIQLMKNNFFSIAWFPGVIGCIDCTHIRIQSAGGDNSEIDRNRKGYFSINVQTVGGADLKIQSIDARWGGSTHDQSIFDNSFMKVRMERQDFGPNSLLLGDGGYALTNYMLTPLSNPRTTAEKKYQKSQIMTRNSVERLYGVWKRRFPTLSLGFRIKKEEVLICIVACAVLHNIAIDLKDNADGFPDVDLGIIPVEPPENLVISSRRNALINSYFSQ